MYARGFYRHQNIFSTRNHFNFGNCNQEKIRLFRNFIDIVVYIRHLAKEDNNRINFTNNYCDYSGKFIPNVKFMENYWFGEKAFGETLHYLISTQTLSVIRSSHVLESMLYQQKFSTKLSSKDLQFFTEKLVTIRIKHDNLLKR